MVSAKNLLKESDSVGFGMKKVAARRDSATIKARATHGNALSSQPQGGRFFFPDTNMDKNSTPGMEIV